MATSVLTVDALWACYPLLNHVQASRLMPRCCCYRTVTPDRSVKSLVAMFIEPSSWNSSLAAYGMWICEILVLFLHGRHSNEFFLRFLKEKKS